MTVKKKNKTWYIDQGDSEKLSFEKIRANKKDKCPPFFVGRVVGNFEGLTWPEAIVADTSHNRQQKKDRKYPYWHNYL